MGKFTFDLQLFADEEMVDAESLGFTADDLKGFIPDEQPEEAPTEPESTETAETTEESTETASDGEHEQSVTEDHSDNLKAALHEEREKRKALAARLKALEDAQARPQQAPAQQQQSPDKLAEIKKHARETAAKSLSIEGNPSDLLFADPEKYEEYVSERARIEYEEVAKYRAQQNTFNENVNFVNELRQVDDFPAVFQYAVNQLDEMPMKQARAIQSAYERVDSGRGTSKDFETLRSFVSDCQKKMAGTNTSASAENAATNATESLTAKLEQAAALPKATQLNGGKTVSITWDEVAQLAAEGKWDAIPKDMAERIKKIIG